MVLDKEINTQLAQQLNLLESDIVLQTDLEDDDNSRKVKEFLDKIVTMSDRISLESTHLKRQPSFGIAQKGEKSRVIFSGLPMGHEFISFILALLQVSGHPPTVDGDTIERIKKIDKIINLETYVSLTYHNCPDVVQAFNIMAVLNLNITHTMIEGGMYQDKVKAKGIMAVPTVCKDQEEFTSGRTSIEQIVENSTTHLMLMLSLVKVSMMFWLLVVVLLETVLQFMLPVKNLKLVFQQKPLADKLLRQLVLKT